jgi:FKBP-type peptidyl-prolyl cis-trans isomerase FklB
MNLQTKMILVVCAVAFISAGTPRAQQTPATTPAPATASQSGSGASGSGSSSGTSSATPAKKSTQTGTGTGTAPKSGTTAAKTGTGTATHRAAAPLVLKTNKDKASYAIGQSMAKSLERGGLTTTEIDTTILARGIRDSLSGAKPAMTDEEQKAALTALSTSARTKMEAKNQVAGDANKKIGDAFLAENKTKDDVVTLPSGLQYKVITQGTGPKPTAADTVVCNYRGTLIDGKEFDASAKHGGPSSFPVSGVIKGWTEALQLMPVGSKWTLYVPSDLAYGARAPGGDIGPNSTLIFDVELVSIKGK